MPVAHTLGLPYTAVVNSLILDKRLHSSGKAFNILVYLLSKPANWEVQETDIQNSLGFTKNAVKQGLRAMREYGYLVYRQVRKNNRIEKWEAWVYDVPQTDTPQLKAIDNNVPDNGETYYGEKQRVGGSAPLVKLTNTLVKLKEEEDASAAELPSVTPAQSKNASSRPSSNAKGGFAFTRNDNAKQPPPKNRFRCYAEQLMDILSKHRRILRTPQVGKWAEELRLFVMQANLDIQEFQDTLNWYAENIDKAFVPQVYSAKGFIEKYPRIRYQIDMPKKEGREKTTNDALAEFYAMRKVQNDDSGTVQESGICS